MISITISVCIVISLMILLMFLVLKRTVKMVNDSSKKYFINTIKEYDEIIDRKNEKLNELKNIIANDDVAPVVEQKVTNTDDKYVIVKTPTYLDENFFENYKKVNDSFNLDKEQVIRRFIEKYAVENNDNINNILLGLKQKLNFDITYKLISFKAEDALKMLKRSLTDEELVILNNYLNQEEKFNISGFISYIDEQIDKTSPTIYVKVGNKFENYDQINPNIKTIYDEKVYTGMIILYKGKLYDYSLDWR